MAEIFGSDPCHGSDPCIGWCGSVPHRVVAVDEGKIKSERMER
jgi:hypothetical protein